MSLKFLLLKQNLKLRACVLASLACFFAVQKSYCSTNSAPKLNQTTYIIPGAKTQAFQYQLPNGLRLIVVPDNRNPIATVHFMLDAGSNRETTGTTGLAHFFEHMMFRKTLGAPEGNYDRVLNSVGGSGNAGTNDSFVTYFTTFPSPALETMLKLESERFKHLDLTEPYFSIEKGAVISERKLRVENDPLARSQEFLRAITERETSMEWLTIGTKKDVQDMKIEAAKKFYESFYTPDNTLLVIGGPFEHKTVANLVNKYFGDWKGQLKTQHTKLPTDYFTRDLNKKFICSAPIMTKRFRFVYPSSHSDLKSIVYSIIFQSLLDDHANGTFERRLVKENLATDFNFYKTYWQNQSYPVVATFSLSKNQSFEAVQKFWEKGVDEVFQKPLTTKIKKQILKQLAVNNAETAERMTALTNTILDNTFFLKNFNAVGAAEKIAEAATTESLRQWIKENLGKHNYYITGIVPQEEAISCQDFFNEFKKSHK